MYTYILLYIKLLYDLYSSELIVGAEYDICSDMVTASEHIEVAEM